MTKNISIEVICFLLILLFTYAALSKLFNYDLFEYQMQNYSIDKYLSWTAPVAELMICVLLIFKDTRIRGLYLSVFMLSVYTFGIAYMLLTKDNLPCSCGGVLRFMTWKQHIVFNVSFILLSLIGITLLKNKRTLKDRHINN